MKAPFPLAIVPRNPGCYLYKDSKGNIIYVGKAKDLRKRVSQYFNRPAPDPKTELLIHNIHAVEFFITENEQEAYLLEANLIRKHKPKFNIDLKGGKRYAYILLTDEKFPRLLTARDTNGKGTYFGPFVSGYLRQTLLRTLRRAFFIRTCRKLPKKPCLRYHIGLCKAPCAGHQTQDEYAKNVQEAATYLKGGSDQLLRELQKRMHEHARKKEYETARELRDQVLALEALREGQLVETASEKAEDAINYVIDADHVELFVFSVRNGSLGDRDEYRLEAAEGFLEEFLKRYYEEKGAGIPRTIIIPEEVDSSLAAYLSEKAGRKVELVVPKRGGRKALLSLVRKNIEVLKEAPTKAAEELRDGLRLAAPVRTIECFDISHLSGTDTVASMVRFVDGQPDKSGYRRFKIRSVEGVDDFRSMQEVVRRRYKRLLDEGRELPDLVVIDGGHEQLSFAMKALDEAGADVPVIGLAKRFEEVYVPGKKRPLVFSRKSEMMRVLTAARDEAHRFGINYQRLLRSKRMKRSTGQGSP